MKDKLILIDINCDLGEGADLYDCDKDRLLMPYISSCNIACGGHAGNKATIKHSIINAAECNLNIGAHPGYPDRENFGRQSLNISKQNLETSVRHQIDCLLSEADQQSLSISHIKFHGALYNDIEADLDLAVNMVKICSQYYPQLKLLGLANGVLQSLCQQYSIDFISEGFMDRSYLTSGKLTPRSYGNALINDPRIAIQQAVTLSRGGSLITSDGGEYQVKVDSICLHGDNPKAIEIAQSLVEALNQENIKIHKRYNNG